MLRARLLCFVLALPTAAQPAVTAADLAEIRALINRQIEAFRRDDAESAFALVSPAVQRAMQRQKDGSWRAAGCHLGQRALTIPT